MSKKNNLQTGEKYCNFCVNKHLQADYKNTNLLKRYVSSFGKIVSKKRSGLCAMHQRSIAAEIKRARTMALLPFLSK